MGALANNVLERRALDLIEVIYDAAVDPGCWHKFLDQLVGVTGASVGSLFLQEIRTAHPLEVCAHVGYEQRFIDQYLEHYGKISPWLPNATHLEAGTIRTAASFAPRQELEKTEFFTDWLRAARSRRWRNGHHRSKPQSEHDLDGPTYGSRGAR